MKKIVIVLLCVFSILIGYIIFDKSDGVGGLREDISLENNDDSDSAATNDED